jgi:hypothetical protein
MSTVHQTVIAERIKANMQSLMSTHPRAVDVLYAEAILPATDSNNEKVGNLDYLESDIDWLPVVPIKMIEASKEVTVKYLADFSNVLDGEMDEPLIVSLSVTAPERSVITLIEVSGGEIVETNYMVLNRQAIGRNGAGGEMYSLIPFRDQDEEIEASTELKIAEIEAAEGITPEPEPAPPALEDIW